MSPEPAAGGNPADLNAIGLRSPPKQAARCSNPKPFALVPVAPEWHVMLRGCLCATQATLLVQMGLLASSLEAPPSRRDSNPVEMQLPLTREEQHEGWT